ncbi:MAG TPA: VacJ family lipoprotein [Candidatus Binataceae bacterium]|nr:VacJ family lipoprotein [Candidatus Binataceae bacterium]
MKSALLIVLLGAVLSTPAFAAQADQPTPGDNLGAPTSEAYADPLAPLNEKIFWFNLRLDQYVLRPVATGYADVLPEPVRRHIGTFWDNVNFIPRFANNLFQLKPGYAAGEAGRFLINTTLGGAGFFDVANSWFKLKQHDTDFGLTLHKYGVPMGPYLVLPFFGPSSIRDTAGRVVDGSMNPISYTMPTWWMPLAIEGGSEAAEAVNYRSLNLQLFEDVDRYSIDLYGAVQDGYIESRHHAEAESATF